MIYTNLLNKNPTVCTQTFDLLHTCLAHNFTWQGMLLALEIPIYFTIIYLEVVCKEIIKRK